MDVVAIEQASGDAMIAAESAMGQPCSKCQDATAVGVVEPRLSAPPESMGGKADNGHPMAGAPSGNHGDGSGEGITEFCSSEDHSKLSEAVAAPRLCGDPSSLQLGGSASPPLPELEVRLNG